MKTYVLYHAACQDGLGAKFAAWKKFGDDAIYIPVKYGQPVPEINGHPRLKLDTPVTVDVEVYIVDFSYPRDVLEELRSRVNTLVILDHHKTAKEALEGFPGAHFDMSKSGAVLAWEYFHPDVPVPKLLLHIQDRDLWEFKLDCTKEITAALPLLRGEMINWDQALGNQVYAMLLDKGETILDYNKIKVENALKNVVILPFKGYNAGVTNYTENPSDLGEAIYNSEELGVDFALTYFINNDGKPVFSFRSKSNFDVSVLAKELGGGGHHSAAGATVTIDVLADLLAGKL